jgi:hypothetical protein
MSEHYWYIWRSVAAREGSVLISSEPKLDILAYRLAGYGCVEMDGFTRCHREFAEWMINEVPLTRLLASQRPGYANTGLALIPVVAWNATGNADVERLLLRRPADMPNGRYSLLSCPECGDTRCGCVSVVIERDEDTFVWHSFGHDEYDPVEDEPWLDEIVGRGPFRFEAANYERVLHAMHAIGVRGGGS